MADLHPLMEQLIHVLIAVRDAHAAAEAAGQIERGISLQLVLRSQGDAVLAMDELLTAERHPFPTGGGPRGGGRRLRAAA